MNPQAAPQRTPVTSKAEADALLIGLLETMDALLYLIEAETKLVRMGKAFEAANMSADKAELARRYVIAFQKVQADPAAIRSLSPQLVERLLERHDSFRAELQVNMTVLATAKAVAESIVKEIGEVVAQQDQPAAYGAKGTVRPATARSSRPVAVSTTA